MKKFLCCLVLIMLLVTSASAIIAPAPRVTLLINPTPTATKTLYIESFRTVATTTTPDQHQMWFVKITSNPSGAELFTFGESTNKSTPFMQYAFGQIPPYPYSFSLKYPGYEDYFFEPVTFTGQNVTLHAEMVPLTTATQTTPAVTEPAPAYQVIFTQPPGTPAQIPSPATQSEQGLASTTATSGSLSVTTTPPGAEILIDNEMRGVTPTLIFGLPAGMHSLGVVKKGYQMISTTISIEPGLTREYSTGLIAIESTEVPVTSVKSPGFSGVPVVAVLVGLLLIRKISLGLF
ncbi:MAG TPA: PEGA domain-containing protein [Methanoregula sp.]|nr:PEGA domain-containing protein [Methanoregula sp.]